MTDGKKSIDFYQYDTRLLVQERQSTIVQERFLYGDPIIDMPLTVRLGP